MSRFTRTRVFALTFVACLVALAPPVCAADRTTPETDRSEQVRQILALKVPNQSKAALLSRYICLGMTWKEIDATLPGRKSMLFGHGPGFVDVTYEIDGFELNVSYYPNGKCYSIGYTKQSNNPELIKWGLTDIEGATLLRTNPETINDETAALRRQRKKR